jgi:hypothetical protein
LIHHLLKSFAVHPSSSVLAGSSNIRPRLTEGRCTIARKRVHSRRITGGPCHHTLLVELSILYEYIVFPCPRALHWYIYKNPAENKEFVHKFETFATRRNRTPDRHITENSSPNQPRFVHRGVLRCGLQKILAKSNKLPSILCAAHIQPCAMNFASGKNSCCFRKLIRMFIRLQVCGGMSRH